MTEKTEMTAATIAAEVMIGHPASAAAETVAGAEIGTTVKIVAKVETAAKAEIVAEVEIGTDATMIAATAETDVEMIAVETDTVATATTAMLATVVDAIAMTADVIALDDKAMTTTTEIVETVLTILSDGSAETDTVTKVETDGTVEIANGVDSGATVETCITEEGRTVATDTVTVTDMTAETTGTITIEIGPAAGTNQTTGTANQTATAQEIWVARWRCYVKCYKASRPATRIRKTKNRPGQRASWCRKSCSCWEFR